MTDFAHTAGDLSNSPSYKCDGDYFWRDVLKSLFPVNTAAYVASLTRTSVGAIEHVMRGRNGLSSRALANLLRSPVGPRVLDAIAGDAEWRSIERRRLRIAELESELQTLEQKRRELADDLSRPR